MTQEASQQSPRSSGNRSLIEGIVATLQTFPKKHLILTAGLLIIIAFLFIIVASKRSETYRKVEIPVELPAAITTAQPEETSSPSEFHTPIWKEHIIRPGDNLSTIFKNVGISASELHNHFKKAPRFKELRNLYPGQTLAFQVDDDNNIAAIRYDKNRLTSLLFERTGSGFAANDIIREPEIRQRHASGEIQDSLFMAGSKAGLPHSQIMSLANIFGGVIDFVYDPRKGDRFNVIYEEKYLDGEKIGYGNIIAAQFTNRKKTYQAFRYTDLSGDTDHFNENGESMRKAFLRAPLDFTRISSKFNLKRRHPIHKKIRAHRGIDYAAPRGTPIYAAGDGRVTKAGYSKANGNYVFIQHGPQYVTKYLHLHKRYVKKGQRVKQKKTIGSVGSTGYATGPHLHYEFLVNGVHRNPRTIVDRLPKAKSIPKKEKDRFLASIEGRKLQLATYRQLSPLASKQYD